MSENLKQKVGAEKGSRDEEMENYSTKNYPKCSSYIYSVNADGEDDGKGKFLHWCHYYDFKTWMRVRYEPKAVIFSVHIGGETLIEAEITKEILFVLEKRWPIAVKRMKIWIEASAEYCAERESAE